MISVSDVGASILVIYDENWRQLLALRNCHEIPADAEVVQIERFAIARSQHIVRAALSNLGGSQLLHELFGAVFVKPKR